MRLVAAAFALVAVFPLSIGAQALLPDNTAEATRAAYRYPTDVEGFELIGEAADPDPEFGVGLEFVAPSDRDTKIDVYLYRAPAARLPPIAVREALERYFAEIEQIYVTDDRRIVDFDRKAEPYELKTGAAEWKGAEHAFRLAVGRTKYRSHTLVFYSHGHGVKFRASSADLSARRLRKLTRELATRFLADFRVEQPFGHQCGPPKFVTVPADDPRRLTFSALGRQYYVPADLKDDARNVAIGEALKQSVIEAIKVGCMGAHITIQESPSESE